jgi:hypothetical protein
MQNRVMARALGADFGRKAGLLDFPCPDYQSLMAGGKHRQVLRKSNFRAKWQESHEKVLG